MNAQTTPPTPELASPSVGHSLRVGIRLVEERMNDWIRSPVPFFQEGAGGLLQAGGKRFRPTLTLLSYLAAGGKPFTPAVLDAAAFIELVHSATLVHDDIIDDADSRRGKPSAHRRYGANRALLLGDHIFSTAVSVLPRLPQEVQKVLIHSARLIAEGEAVEIELTRAGSATLEDYFVVIAKKTASLMEAATAAGALCARPDGDGVDAFAEFGFHSGVAFQLMDDLLDVEGVTELTGKPTQWDLTRGVPNAAVLMTLEADLRGKPAPIRLPGGIEHELDSLLARMAEIGGDERVRRLARMYGTRALDALRQAPPSEARHALEAEVEKSLTRIR